MKRKLINVAVVLITFALGVWVASLAHSMLGPDQNIEIPQQQLLAVSSCVEERTPDEFSTFWHEFHGPVRREDKRKLFSMMQKCSVYWTPLSGTLVKPGRVPSQLGTPFDVSPTFCSNRVQDLRFRTKAFPANYDTIFSESIRGRFLRSEPGPSAECDRAIIWRDHPLSHLCFNLG
jgi:hypothetical protein